MFIMNRAMGCKVVNDIRTLRNNACNRNLRVCMVFVH